MANQEMARSLLFISFIGLSLATFNPEKDLSSTQNPYHITQVNETSNGYFFIAKYTGENPPSDTIQELNITLSYIDSFTFRLEIDSSTEMRFRPPDSIVSINYTENPRLYEVHYTTAPMSIYVTRNSDGLKVFDLAANQPFVFKNRDISFINDVDYDIKVMGFGERVSKFILNEGTYTMWSRDRPSPLDFGLSPGLGNMYGVHPFYLALDEGGKAFGGFLLNSNAQNAEIGETFVGFRTTGGMIDYFGFVGESVSSVIESYHNIIGYPVLTPFWSLGWHESRYGYKTLNRIEEVVKRYNSEGIPLDVIWSDIDYMESYKDFTLNSTSFPTSEFSSWISGLHSSNKKFVPIVDAGIAAINGYSTYDSLKSTECYIKDPYESTSAPILGKVWPGPSAFVDWTHKEATNFWIKELEDFETLVKFSGIWLDMNEVSNFVDGSIFHAPTLLNCTNGLDWCPGDVDLNEKSLDISAIHAAGEDYTEFNLHSMYGFMETTATFEYFYKHGLRPFIISRSSFPGHGRYGSKWLGDNFSEWPFLEYSITGVFNFEMFGIPLVGADICGFGLNTTEELCSRWMELGTLYPFSRNHNNISSVDQEPWSFGSTLLENSKLAIRNKYWLHLYFYTGMFKVSEQGGLFFKPAFVDYPGEENLVIYPSKSFLLGEALIVHPCLEEGVTSKEVYFPYDNWYNLYTGEPIILGYDNMVNLEMPLVGKVNIHMKASEIVPVLNNYDTAMNLVELRKSEITLIVAPDGSANAFGLAIFDDGISIDTIHNRNYTEISYYWSPGGKDYDKLTLTKKSKTYYVKPEGDFPYVSNLRVYNCYTWPKMVTNNSTGTEVEVESKIDWDYRKSVCSIDMSGPNRVVPDEDGELLIYYYL